MKKAFVLAMGLLALSWGLSFGDLQVHKARYLGNPRINPGTEPAWHNYNGRGPCAFPGTAVFLDSSATQFGIYISRLDKMSSNGANVVGIGLSHEVFTSTDTGMTWEIDPFMQLRGALIDFTAPDCYGFVIGVDSSGVPFYMRNSGGYGSGLWDASVDIRPSGEHYMFAMGFWLGDVSPYHILVVMVKADTTDPLMSEVIDTLGNVVSDIQTVFDQGGGTADCRDGKVACFGGGPTDGMNIKTSTDGGVTWQADSMNIWAFSADSGWWEWNNVVLQDGSVGVLVTMDQSGHLWDGHNTPHGALQFFMKNQPFPNKVTIFHPTMDQACTFPMISRKDDNTLVATFMYVESGWDSVAWASGGCYWDIGESHSTDGGLTWSAVRNITNTPSISECCIQTAKHIGTNNKLHITYGTRANNTDPPDIYWNVEFAGGAQEIYNWYLGNPSGVEEQEAEGPGVVACGLGSVSPNPMRGSGTIAYQLSTHAHTSLTVYNALGQRVKTLLDRVEPAGRSLSAWDAQDESGARVPPGIYFFRLCSGSFTQVREVVVVR